MQNLLDCIHFRHGTRQPLLWIMTENLFLKKAYRNDTFRGKGGNFGKFYAITFMAKV